MTTEHNPFAAVLGEIFGRTVEAPADPGPDKAAPTPAGFEQAASALLEGFGLAGPEERDGVCELVTASLDALGLDAEVGSFRYGVLAIDADPVTARLLRLETARLLDVLERTYPGEVVDLTVRVRRPRRRRSGVGDAARA